MNWKRIHNHNNIITTTHFTTTTTMSTSSSTGGLASVHADKFFHAVIIHAKCTKELFKGPLNKTESKKNQFYYNF